jgi:hypothetical protein
MRDERMDELAVREVVERYVDAVFRADVAELRACFHPTAAMTGYLGDDLLAAGPQPFFEDVARTSSMQSMNAPYEAEVVSVEVVGDAAAVRLDETGFFGTLSFVNWFHLIRTPDSEWRIVSKLFAARPSEPEQDPGR